MEENKQILIRGEMIPVSTVSRRKRLYWERKNSRLCTSCGAASEDGKALCPGCRERLSEYRKQGRLFYSALGLCSACGRNRVFKGEKMCPECRAKAAAWRAVRGSRVEMCGEKKAEQSKKKSEYAHKKYWERVEQGICTGCGRRRAEAGKRMCGICAHKKTEHKRETYRMKHMTCIPRENRVQNGLCFNCGSALDIAGKKICSSCCSRQTENLKKARNKGRAGAGWGHDNKIVFRKKNGGSSDAVTENAKRIFQSAPYADALLQKTW